MNMNKNYLGHFDRGDNDDVMLFGIKKENGQYYLLLSETSDWKKYASFSKLISKIENLTETCVKLGKPVCHGLSEREQVTINITCDRVVNAFELEELSKTDEERDNEVPC